MRGVTRIVGIEASSKGFCFAVLEDTERLIDWGGREVKGKTGIFIKKLGQVIDRYRPDVIVLEDPAGSLKSDRVKEWLVWAEEYAHEQALKPVAVLRGDLLTFTAPLGKKKHEMARSLARLFPELERLVPPPRKTWESEKWRTGIFVALARTRLVARQMDTAGK